MPKSAAYARIKSNVLAITRSIPHGRVSSFQAIGQHLDVVPRQVAYLLATLSSSEQQTVPWYRVVSDTGTLDRDKYDHIGRSQKELLAEEGIQVTAKRQIAAFAQAFFPVTEATTGVPAGQRPTTSPD
ncbi:MAG: MGMT family protein [Roseiflexaceae bacterium]|nr:MGMT family protein [Roseiflexaceae bacterium]